MTGIFSDWIAGNSSVICSFVTLYYHAGGGELSVIVLADVFGPFLRGDTARVFGNRTSIVLFEFAALGQEIDYREYKKEH